MQISSETIFNPAMGVGLTAGHLHSGSETAQGSRRQAFDSRARTEYTAPYRRSARRTQDCAYIFQCA